MWVTAGQVLVEMHVTNWAAAQKEDPELNAVLQWLGSRKKADLRTLLGECIMSDEGWMVLSYLCLLKVKCVYLTIGVFVLFGSKEYYLSCDQQHLPEAILVTAGMKVAVCWQGCRMKVGFARLACSASFVEPSSIPVERGSS